MIGPDSLVLITGAGGFIGKTLVRQLNQNGVLVLALHSKQFLEPVPPALIQSKDILSLIHLAGISDLKYCEQNPLEAHEMNVERTRAWLLWCQKLPIKNFIFASSAEVYEPRPDCLLKENDPTVPKTVYGVSKLAAELLVQQASHIPHRFVLRMANVYGPDDSGKNTIIAKIRKNVLSQEPIDGSREFKKDFIFIDDVVSAINSLLFFSHPNKYQVFNVATGQATSFAELIRIFSELTQQKLKLTSSAGTAELSPLLDSSLLMKTTGWTPKTSLTEGLKKTFYAR